MSIAVWYHAKIEGWGIPDPGFGLHVAGEQMSVLQACGLSESASEIHIGVNGPPESAEKIRAIAPAKSVFHLHGDGAVTEIPTMEALRRWLPGHGGWFVLYHHSKGVTHPWETHFINWRNRLEVSCVVNWRTCIRDLESGKDAAGCHWIPPQGPPHTSVPFFGGTFWWARADYLMRLPLLPAAVWENRYHAEDWIGSGKPPPKVVDYRPGWP